MAQASDLDEMRTGMETDPLVPGTVDNAITAQRRLRGILFLMIVIGIVLNVIIGLALIGATNSRDIHYLPTVRAAGELIGGREATDTEIQNQSMSLLMTSENFTAATIDAALARINPYLDPEIQSFFARYYGDAQSQMRGSPVARIAVPFRAIIISRDATMVTVVVPYERKILRQSSQAADITRANRGWSVDESSRRVAILRWRQRESSIDNPFGLYLARIDHMTRADWLAAGRADIWSTGR